MSNHDLKICLFYCSNSSDGTRLTECCSKVGVGTLKMIGLPCSGKVNLPYLLKAFETGADAVVLVTCRQEECRSLEGNLRAQRRGNAVDSLLEEIGLGTGRIVVVPAADNVEEVCSQLKVLCSRIAQDSWPPHVATRSEPEGLQASRSTS
jgi:coenzyme F420-reducing hydrogenase delta subunit